VRSSKRSDALPLTGRRTRLVPLSRTFADELYELVATSQIPWGWGRPETPRGFQDSLWDRVLVQFAIEDTHTGRSIGLLRADNANLLHRYAYVSMILVPEHQYRAWPLEAAALFGNYLFKRYDLEHLYAETSDENLKHFRSGVGRVFEVEGRLQNRLLVRGERQDLYILSFSRERALKDGAALIERLTGATM
jgi:RimJ/RimL family protein N-acetyltransferase